MVLDKIIAQKQTEIEQLPEHNIQEIPINHKDMVSAIMYKPKAIIGELKSKSPSEGIINEHYNPIDIAHHYAQGGVAAISVLTDQHFFGGSFKDLYKVSKYIDLPTLCKDFILDEKQIFQARLNGASACLLIVRILTDEQLNHLNYVIEKLGMTALVEIFDEADLERALKIKPKMIGINNRCLNTLKMDMENAKRLKPQIPNSCLVLSLSGAKTPQEANQIATEFDGVLIGTALMRAENKVTFLEQAQG
jgi:indole-3-glycerol phosphate synthase